MNEINVGLNSTLEFPLELKMNKPVDLSQINEGAIELRGLEGAVPISVESGGDDAASIRVRPKVIIPPGKYSIVIKPSLFSTSEGRPLEGPLVLSMNRSVP